MPVSGPILVFLANGTQGSAVVRAAERRGHRVRALIRARVHDSPAETVISDLDDPASVMAAARGCAHAVLQVPTGEEAVMIRQAVSALDAIGQASVRSIVLKLASASRPAPCAEPSRALSPMPPSRHWSDAPASLSPSYGRPCISTIS